MSNELLTALFDAMGSISRDLIGKHVRIIFPDGERMTGQVLSWRADGQQIHFALGSVNGGQGSLDVDVTTCRVEEV